MHQVEAGSFRKCCNTFGVGLQHEAPRVKHKAGTETSHRLTLKKNPKKQKQKYLICSLSRRINKYISFRLHLSHINTVTTIYITSTSTAPPSVSQHQQ